MKFVAMYVETSDTSDCKPRCLGIFDTRDEAVAEVNADMETYAEANDIELTHKMIRNMSVFDEAGDNGCEWSIDEA